MRPSPRLFKNEPNEKKLWLSDYFKPKKKGSYLYSPPNYYVSLHDGTNLLANLMNKHEPLYSTASAKKHPTFATGTEQDNKHVIKVEVRQESKEFILEGHTGPICALGFSPDEKRLVSCSADGSIRLWDLANKSCIACLEGIEIPIPNRQKPEANAHCIIFIHEKDENCFHIELNDRSVKELFYGTEAEMQSRVTSHVEKQDEQKCCLAM